MRILIVDDDKTFCEFLAEVLGQKGDDVDWTTHSLEGYKMFLQKHYDLSVLDVRMSPLPGTDLAEKLKQQSPGTNIILISAFADEARRRTAQSLGLPLRSKPFSTDNFLDLVEKTAAGQ